MKLLMWFFTIMVLVSGCNPENAVSTEPQEQGTQTNWITLDGNSSLNVEDNIIINQNINGETGGKISINESLVNGIKIHGSLSFPQNAFPGSLNISIVVNSETTVLDFYPSPYNFNKPLILDLEYEGLNITSLVPGKTDFYYMNAYGGFEKVEYSDLKIDIQKGSLKLTKAIIPHFSRYGFAK